MALFHLRTTTALVAAAGMAWSGLATAQGTPPAMAPPTAAITSPDTPVKGSNNTDASAGSTTSHPSNTTGTGTGSGAAGSTGGAHKTPPATAPAQPASPAVRGSTTPAPATTDGKPAHADAAFMDQAAQNGHAEVEAAKLALEKSQSGEVRTFAQRMIDDHSKAAQELQTLASAKNHKLPDGPSLLQKGKLKMMGTHDGAKFDRSYIDSMGTKAHRETIELFEKGMNQAKDPDVKAYAQKTLPTLREHLQLSQKLELDTRSASKGTKR